MLTRWILVLGLGVAVAAPAYSQAGPAPRRPAPAVDPEGLLRQRERLELTEQQTAQLRAFREQAVQSRQRRTAELLELRSRMRAGELSREEFRRQLSQRRASERTGAEESRERILEVLTEQQQQRLQQGRREALARRGLAARRGTLGVRPGAGTRGWSRPMQPRRPASFGPRAGVRGRAFLPQVRQFRGRMVPRSAVPPRRMRPPESEGGAG